MQVDNAVAHQPFFASSSSNLNDFSDIFNTDMFAHDMATNDSSSASPATASSSRASSPQSPTNATLLTPPQPPPTASFPEYPSTYLSSYTHAESSFFNFLDEEQSSKTLDMGMGGMGMSTPYDFIGAFGGAPDMRLVDPGMMDINMDLGMYNQMETISMGIDPQLVGTPSALSDIGEEQEQGDEHDHHHDDDTAADGDVSASPSATSAASPAISPTLAKKTRGSTKKNKDAVAAAALEKAKQEEKEGKEEQERERLTLVIQPVKAGGHGKARRGTVQSGGITKKSASSSLTASSSSSNPLVSSSHSSVIPAPSSAGKESASLPTSAFTPSQFTLTSSVPPTYTHPSLFMPTNLYPQKSSGLNLTTGSGGNKGTSEKGGDEDGDDDELPHDWRPSPEVFQKMTSKEKRQLRNKISARNFRVRRKEYISTLEGDIAERDRLLDAIRSELGSTQSENLALRQEIAALKRTLLDGRGAPSSPNSSSIGLGADVLPMLNLPPPAPLPATSAAASLALQAQAAATPVPPASAPTNATVQQLLTVNTQKDASASGQRFWGGARLGMGGMGMGGITPVHRVVLPEVSVADVLLGREKLQENMNPLMNGGGVKQGGAGEKVVGGFEGFADLNPFTMKTLDAYRMHLWGKMAAQHHQHQQNQQQQHPAYHQTHLTGLAASLRPAFFSAPTSTSPLSSLLSGKHSPAPPYTQTPSTPPPPYQSAPPSPVLGYGKTGVAEKLEREQRARERERQKEKEKETAMYAALASQTLLRKLGSAFWDAFSGSSSASSSVFSPTVGAHAFAASGSGSRSSGARAWDADKVRRVLEGKAVVRVVDVEDLTRQTASQTQTQVRECPESLRKCCTVTGAVTDILEESMRSLSLGKKT
ncbi:hypothetical protein DXG03_004007 [Asterophora parasitica]|uniref:BZIP domain-containing protein n=1 Tax=Asterophora parasitica TaxID=117018 RepID=A0A9P7G2S7_9AGAR|nr:hypothetical protein DXG03_004007 [Asterophora parasitica]